MLINAIGLVAAFCASVSYLPQVIKCWRTRETEDLSLSMLVLLTVGLALWIVYGVLKGDWVVAGANVVSASLTGCVLIFKLLEVFGVVQAKRSA